MPPKINDLTGKRFGRLLVISRAQNSWDGKPKWNCVCDCGTECVKYGSALTCGYTKSCGCYNREVAGAKQYKHGETRGRLHSVWNMMKQRCSDPHNKYYKNYGGRGISVCDEWRNSYVVFRDWALSNGYDPKAEYGRCTIDRIDNNGDYCPENCRIVSMKEQSRNTRRNRLIEFRGETKTLAAWDETTGIKRSTIAARLKSGWSVEEALTIKTNARRNKNNGERRAANC